MRCGVHGGDEKHIQNFSWKISVEGTIWGFLDVEKRMILKWILRK